MPPITKFKGKQIKDQTISDSLIGPREIVAPTPTNVEITKFDNLTHFIQHTANRLKYVQENLGGSVTGSGFVAIQVEKQISGFYGGDISVVDKWYSVFWQGASGYFYYDIFDENIDANSIVEIIPLDADAEIISKMDMKLRIESHSGFVRIFADNYPFNIEDNKNLNVKLNIYKQVLKENEYVVEYNVVYYSPTGKRYGFMYWVDNEDENQISFDGGISPLPSQFSTKPAGVWEYSKYFLHYYDNGTIQISGNVQSLEVNGTIFETVNSYNATYNYTILAAPTNPFPLNEPTGVTFDQAVIVKIIFNE